MNKATFAGGCFWCMEAVFQNIRGVHQIISGYAGRKKKSPPADGVNSESTKSVEAVQIDFDPKLITYKDLLYIFFRLHDPTTLNRQGPDVGEQYRSVIFYHNLSQKKAAKKARDEAQNQCDDPIVTEIKPFETFYETENYHQDYYRNNPNQAYCRFIIDPKIEKLKTKYQKYLNKT